MKQSRLKRFFGIQDDPKELVRKWQSSLRSEKRGVERQIRDITSAKKKAETAVKAAAKRGDMASVRILAKELVQTKRAVTQLHSNRAHITSMEMALTEQLAVIRVSGALERSTQIMETIAKLLKVPEMMQISQELAREMEKAGLIEEIVMEAFDSALDEEDLEEETEAEVNKVMMELASEVTNLPTAQQPVQVPTSFRIAHKNARQVEATEVAAQEVEVEDDEALTARLAAIRG